MDVGCTPWMKMYFLWPFRELTYPIKIHFWVDDFPNFPRWDMWIPCFFLENDDFPSQSCEFSGDVASYPTDWVSPARVSPHRSWPGDLSHSRQSVRSSVDFFGWIGWENIRPQSLTAGTWKWWVFKRDLLFQGAIFRFHVSFREDMENKWWWCSKNRKTWTKNRKFRTWMNFQLDFLID